MRRSLGGLGLAERNGQHPGLVFRFHRVRVHAHRQGDGAAEFAILTLLVQPCSAVNRRRGAPAEMVSWSPSATDTAMSSAVRPGASASTYTAFSSSTRSAVGRRGLKGTGPGCQTRPDRTGGPSARTGGWRTCGPPFSIGTNPHAPRRRGRSDRQVRWSGPHPGTRARSGSICLEGPPPRRIHLFSGGLTA